MENTGIFRIGQKHKKSHERCRILLGILCVLLLVIGFSSFIAGSLFMWSGSTVHKKYQKQIDSFLHYHGSTSRAVIKNTLHSTMLEYTAPIGHIGFWLGLLIMAFSTVGLYGSVRKNRFAIFTFSSMMLAKILVLSVIIMAYHAKPLAVSGTFKAQFEESVMNYRSVLDTDKHSLLLNAMMPALGCCGVDDGEDFRSARNFDKRYKTGKDIMEIQYPYSCCKLGEDYEPLSNNCPFSMDDSNSYINKGCWPIVEELIQEGLSISSYLVVLVLVLELIVTCIAIHTSLAMEGMPKCETYRPDVNLPCPPPSNA